MEKIIGIGTVKVFDTLAEYTDDFNGNGDVLGDTEGGSALKVNGTYEEIRVDQSMDPDTIIKTQNEIVIDTVLKDVAKATMLLLFPEFTDATSEVYMTNTAMLDLKSTAKVCVVRPFGYTNDDRDYIIHKAVLKPQGAFSFDKSTLQGVELQIQAIRNDNAGESEKVLTIRKNT